MKRILSLVCCCALTAVLGGCGPMQTPMPVRLDDDGQKKIDDAWNKALTPMDRVDHSALLDAFLVSHAYQVGVDKLTFHSEKKVAVGTVIMDIQYDRSMPTNDRFEVRVVDSTLKVLRQETYYRKEIEDANQELFVRSAQLDQAQREGHATPEQLKELAALKAREDAVVALFPKDEQVGPKGEAEKP